MDRKNEKKGRKKRKSEDEELWEERGNRGKSVVN